MKKTKICVIGAGISGLTIAKLLNNNFDVIVAEKEVAIGGIARTRNIQGIAYHMVGGHCLNSKNKQVMDFIFNEILPKENWHSVKRDAKIYFKNHLISYPIEYAIKEIAEFDEELAFNITKDFLSTEDKTVNNLYDWFCEKFGKTLANEYFIPYNKKIWQQDPKKMSPLWISGKLPLPNKLQFFKGLLKEESDAMPHSTFYYPNANNQNTFIEALSNELNIKMNFEVISIEKVADSWIINDKEKYDIVINTMPLNILPGYIKNTPKAILDEAKKLKYTKVTNVLWKTSDVTRTWTYYPSNNTIFHRHIHIGNFFDPKQNYTITESMGVKSYDDMVREGKKSAYLIEPLAYNVSEHAYVVYDQNYDCATKKIKEYLKEIGLYTLGRFGEWEYYNMDICMESAMVLADSIKNEQ